MRRWLFAAPFILEEASKKFRIGLNSYSHAF